MAQDHDAAPEGDLEPPADSEDTSSTEDTASESDSDDASKETEHSAGCCEHCSKTRESVDDHRNRIEGVEKHVGDIGGVLDRLTTHLESQSSSDGTAAKAKPAPKVTDSKPSGGHFLTKKWGGAKQR